MNQERRSEIMKLIREEGIVKNEDLIKRFNVSIETIRRDLKHLELSGNLKRVYGGAVKKTLLASVEPEYAKREKENFYEKSAISAAAVELIAEGDTVFFDVGTTVLLLAELLKGIHLTAFTNSVRAAIELAESPECHVVMAGGCLRFQELAISGSLAENNVRGFNFNKAFLGAAGITEKGITDFHVDEASLRRQVIQNAEQVIVLADYQKFGVRAANNICSLKEIDILITDDKAPKEMLRLIEMQGVHVIVAKSESSASKVFKNKKQTAL